MEDSFFIAVYKNPRILVHSDGEDNKTLINAVAFYLENKKAPDNCLARCQKEKDSIIKCFSKLPNKNSVIFNFLVV